MKTIQANRTYRPLLLGLVLFAALAAISALWANHTSTVEAAPPMCVGGPTVCKALLNTDTVTGGAGSVEATLAAADGFTVTSVNGAAWTAMNAAQFATYRVLIAGDPTCGVLAASFTGNRATWAPVVMGTSVNTLPGNRIVIGTDPVFHHGAHPGADKLMADGIAFAGALPGRTGVYLDTTCAGNADELDTLEKLSTGSTPWSLAFPVPCGGSVSVIASNVYFGTPPGGPSALGTSDLSGWSCSDHRTYPHHRSDWSVLAIATDTPPPNPDCGNDINSGAAVCGQAYILVSGVGIVVTAPNISVSPATATNPQGTNHTVTATVTTSGGAPVVGQMVTFTVTGQNNGATGTCVPAGCITNASGQVSFTYHDGNGCGDDTILASFVDPLTGTTQQASATKHWNCATPSPTPNPTPCPGCPVGGLVALPVAGSGSTFPWMMLMATASGALALLAAGIWYGRRRSLR